jgi:gliding motility-associated transport system permease protein/gliding motility-associatede transport system auxiliary component
MLKWHVIKAIFLRNVQSYFSGPLGYLFIVVFVTVSSALAFNTQFFANNQATLDQLSRQFPVLLLFLVPAITMSVWADEKKHATDELLFTLPASDVEILLGKYFAVLAVYSVALLFSATNLFVLRWIGSPDWGVIFTTYLGYWLAGASLLAAGMFASALTGSATIAFVVGTLICAVPVFLSSIAGSIFSGFPSIENLARSLSVGEQLRNFTDGLVPLTGFLYFASLAAFMLYLNLVVVARRHWAAGKQAKMGLHYAARTLALAAALVGFNVVADNVSAYVPVRFDLTAGSVHTLTGKTKELLEQAAEDDKPVVIEAYLSPDVPQEFVPVRQQLVSLLRQYDRLGRGYVTVRFVDVRPASREADSAKEVGIKPVRHQTQRAGRSVEQEVYLGVRVMGGLDEKVIPAFDRNTAIEYELTRTIGSVVGSKQLTVGILRTDARVLGMGKEWHFNAFVESLRKQYKVVDVSHADLAGFVKDPPKSKPDDKTKTRNAKTDAKTQPDVLIVVQASSLPSGPMDDLVKYIRNGRPALVFDDPLPFYLIADQTQFDDQWTDGEFEVLDAPRLPRAQPRSMWALKLIPPKPFEEIVKWAREVAPRMGIRSQQQFEFELARQMNRIYPEATPQVSGVFPSPKAAGGTAAPLMRALGLAWKNGEVIADSFNPHPTFRPEIPQKVAENYGSNWPVRLYGKRENALLFLTRDRAGRRSLNSEHPVTKGLNEVLAIYAGHVGREGKRTELKPLLWAPAKAATIAWTIPDPEAPSEDKTRGNLVKRNEIDVPTRNPVSGTVELTTRYEKSRIVNIPRGIGIPTGGPPRDKWRLNDNPQRETQDKELFVAVHVTGGKSAGGKKGAKAAASINVIYVADVDLISDFAVRQQSALKQPLDNFNFVFNAIESLADETGYLPLRGRRVNSRALTAIQSTVEQYRQERFDEEEKIKKQTRQNARDAQKNFNKVLEKIRKNKGLSVSEQDQLQAVAYETERRRLKLKIDELNRQREQTIVDLKNKEERKIRDYENKVRYFAVALPPIPALLLGLSVLASRFINERRNINPHRRA